MNEAQIQKLKEFISINLYGIKDGAQQRFVRTIIFIHSEIDWDKIAELVYDCFPEDKEFLSAELKRLA